MPAKKYDQETKLVIRIYWEHMRGHPSVSKLAARKHISWLLDIKQATLRNWIEREDIDAGERPSVSSEAAAQRRSTGSVSWLVRWWKTFAAAFVNGHGGRAQ